MLFSTMLPLASATGYATIVGSVSFALVFGWWLLRSEAREAAARGEADETTPPDGESDGVSPPP